MDEDTGDHSEVISFKPGSNSMRSVAPRKPTACAPKIATAQATTLFACYRIAEASEPKLYVRAVEAMLREYSESVVRAVCDPVHGLPSRSKFLPSIAEIKKACEKANGTWKPKDGTLTPQGYVYDSSKVGGIDFLASPRGRRADYDD